MSQVRKIPLVRKSFRIDIDLPGAAYEQENGALEIREIPEPSAESSSQSLVLLEPPQSPVTFPPRTANAPAQGEPSYWIKNAPALAGVVLILFLVFLILLETSHSPKVVSKPLMDSTVVVADTSKREDSAKAGTPTPKKKSTTAAAEHSLDANTMLHKAQQRYESGDFSDAFRLFEQAAKAGNSRAQFQVGFMCLKGQGTDRDFSSSARWLRKSANNGNAEAMRFLGDLYANGDGVESDLDMARSCYRKAAAHGDVDAKQALEAMDGN